MTTIAITIGNERREVEVRTTGNGFHVIPGIEMMTQTGTKIHRGSSMVKAGKEEYTDRDMLNFSYHGMRGNGVGRRSTMRMVRWAI